MSGNFQKFKELHNGTKLLCLPNAWDAGSAKVFESVGASAIATTSAGAAWALGYLDGRVMPAVVGIAAARNMGRVLTVPLSFDVGHGYSDNADTVADNTMRRLTQGLLASTLKTVRMRQLYWP